MKKYQFTEELKNRFRDYISGRCGLYFKDYDLRNLEDAIFKRAEFCQCEFLNEYYTYLTTAQKREDEFRELLNLLTVNHTYFFRNKPHFDVLREKALPEIIRKRKKQAACLKGQKPLLRIWSAGCSSGEEPYTIAMIVRDAVEDLSDYDIQIIATDASTQALDKARAGIYGENSVYLIEPRYMQKYFRRIENPKEKPKFALSDTIKKMVFFDYHNLITDEYPVNCDIIFCRNVTIYFELSTTLKIIERFYSNLAEDGYFFIGYSESLQFICRKFKMYDWKDAIFYRKVSIEALPLPETPIPAVQEAEEIITAISRAQIQAEEQEESQKNIPLPSRDVKELLIEAVKLSHLKQYDSALSLIKEVLAAGKKSVEPYYISAEIHANQGRFNQAREELACVLRLNALFVPAHYLYGSIYMEEQNLVEAEKSLKKAIYLDKNFILAYYNLAIIYRRQGRYDDAVRAYRNTLKILSQSAPAEIIPYSGGFNIVSLLGVCKSNIERLKAEAKL